MLDSRHSNVSPVLVPVPVPVLLCCECVWRPAAARLADWLRPFLLQGEFVACLLSLLQLMTDVHFQRLMDACQSQDELKVGQPGDASEACSSTSWSRSALSPQELLMKILCVFRNLMKLSIFPRDWNIMRLLTSR